MIDWLIVFSEPGAGGVRTSWREPYTSQELLYADVGASYASGGDGWSSASHHDVLHLQTTADQPRQSSQTSRSVAAAVTDEWRR